MANKTAKRVMNNNPIIVIDDDDEDLELLEQAFSELKIENEIIIFNNGFKFLDFIRTTDKKSFFILCDINMNNITGIEMKKIIQEDKRLQSKCIPFLLYSTSKASNSILEAYSLNVQGYFVKPDNFEDIKDMLYSMIKYWGYSQHPNS